MGNYANYRFTLERHPCINKNFCWFQFSLIRLVAEKFEKMSKMKLLSSFQLATLFTKQRCTDASSDFLYLLCDDMN